MLFCVSCGKAIEENSNFCASCGAEVKWKDRQDGQNTRTDFKNEETERNNDSGKRTEQSGDSYSREENANFKKFMEYAKKFVDTEDTTYEYSKREVAEGRKMAILCYIGFLVLIPFISSHSSRYVRYHVTQGMNLFCLEVLASILFSIVRKILMGIFFNSWAVSALLGFAQGIIGFVLFILAVIGVVNAASDKAREIPWIGSVRIFK
jgi:uncharacterized membrane protein